MLIRRYYRRKRNGHMHPRGVVVINCRPDKTASVGFSLTASCDRFKKSTANDIALERAASGRYEIDINDPDSIGSMTDRIPFSLHDTYYRMCEWLNMPNRNIR